MVQIIDVSPGVMYDQQKAENSFLALINACVSHELRNPLNSIMAQNIEKQHLYEELFSLLEMYRQKGSVNLK
jgi:signal transduction histidine kinase